jgi:hypothetical protein
VTRQDSFRGRRLAILASLGKASSICGWQPAHDELDLVIGELAPGFDLGHIGRFGEALEPLARFCPCFAARQAKRLPPPCAFGRARALAPAAPVGDAPGKIDRLPGPVAIAGLFGETLARFLADGQPGIA